MTTVSPSNAPAMAKALEAAADAGIPVLTWDADLLDEDKGLRAAFQAFPDLPNEPYVGEDKWGQAEDE